MNLTPLEHGAAFHVVRHAHDLEDIYTLQGHRNPWLILNAVMAYQDFGWVAWAGEVPAAVFGAMPHHAGCWQVFLMATADFPKVMLGLTRFARREVVPQIWDLGGHRIQCDLHEGKVAVHRWVEGFGAVREARFERYAPDGAAYVRYALTKPLD